MMLNAVNSENQVLLERPRGDISGELLVTGFATANLRPVSTGSTSNPKNRGGLPWEVFLEEFVTE